MESLSYKAKIVYAAMDMLNARSSTQTTNSYMVLDLISENEDLAQHELLKDLSEQQFVDYIMDMTIKGVSALMSSLAKKDIAVKTEPHNIYIDGIQRTVREYFLIK